MKRGFPTFGGLLDISGALLFLLYLDPGFVQRFNCGAGLLLKLNEKLSMLLFFLLVLLLEQLALPLLGFQLLLQHCQGISLRLRIVGEFRNKLRKIRFLPEPELSFFIKTLLPLGLLLVRLGCRRLANTLLLLLELEQGLDRHLFVGISIVQDGGGFDDASFHQMWRRK